MPPGIGDSREQSKRAVRRTETSRGNELGKVTRDRAEGAVVGGEGIAWASHDCPGEGTGKDDVAGFERAADRVICAGQPGHDVLLAGRAVPHDGG